MSDDFVEIPPPPPVIYERRLVAFIDVLGWASLVERSIDDPALLDQLAIGARHLSLPARSAAFQRDFWKKVGGDFATTVEISQFSDSLVLSCLLECLPISNLVLTVQMTCGMLLDQGHYTRGAIVVGLIHHSEDMVFGPALIEAYRLERDVAKYPRVLIRGDALPYVNPKVENPDGSTTCYRTVRVDHDGLRYLDIFGFARGTVDQPRASSWGIERKALEKAKAAAREERDLGRLAKHNWMIRYLSDVLRECGEGGAGD